MKKKSHPQQTVAKAKRPLRNDLGRLNTKNVFCHKQKQCVRIFHSLEKSKLGINNLQQTYRDDTTMHTQLQIIIDEIDDFVSIVSQQSQMHFLLLSSSPTVVPASSPVSGLAALQLPHAHVSSSANSDST